MKREKTGSGKNGERKIPPRNTGLRMKELAEATGLPKSAILHYVAQGLLPEPLRTGPNMAYYDPSCIDKVKFIKAMQGAYSFPLSKIKLLLSKKELGRHIYPLIELSETIFGREEGPALNAAEFCQEAGLDREQVRKLTEEGFLLPLKPGIYSGDDVAAGRMYATGIAMGTELSDMGFYVDAAKRIVDGEMRLRQKLTAHLPEERDAEMTRRMVEAARTIRNYIIDRVFQRRVASAEDLKDKRLLS